MAPPTKIGPQGTKDYGQTFGKVNPRRGGKRTRKKNTKQQDCLYLFLFWVRSGGLCMRKEGQTLTEIV